MYAGRLCRVLGLFCCLDKTLARKRLCALYLVSLKTFTIISEGKMSLQSDRWIRQMAKTHGMIEPFVENQVRFVQDEKVISYGLSSYGYDMRVSNEFMVFTNLNNSIVDPKNFSEDAFVRQETDVC